MEALINLVILGIPLWILLESIGSLRKVENIK